MVAVVVTDKLTVLVLVVLAVSVSVTVVVESTSLALVTVVVVVTEEVEVIVEGGRVVVAERIAFTVLVVIASTTAAQVTAYGYCGGLQAWAPAPFPMRPAGARSVNLSSSAGLLPLIAGAGLLLSERFLAINPAAEATGVNPAAVGIVVVVEIVTAMSAAIVAVFVV